jgi:sec-independent protein translocase protein TatB
MFGMGFMEIMIIAVIAVIFLGPDKLPEAMINIAKFFRSFKTTISDAKNSIEQEMNISELKKEALGFKNELTAATGEIDRIKGMANLDLPELDDFKPGVSATPTVNSPVESFDDLDDGLQKEILEKSENDEKEITFKKEKKVDEIPTQDKGEDN